MAFDAAAIKNLALTEINHEIISDWTDTTNTDIAIINQQYELAKQVALSAYQWSFATRYVKTNAYEYAFNQPADRQFGDDVYTMPTAKISQSVGDSLQDLTISAVTFTIYTGVGDGIYTFTFDGSDWKDEDNNIVNLADYGITFTGTPVATDALSVDYVEPKDAPHISNEDTIYADETQIFYGYIDTSDTQQYVVLDGTPITDIVSNYKRATIVPSDFLGYLAAYNDAGMNALNDFLNVGNIIYTNAKELYLKYVANIEETALTPEFVDWFKTFFATRLNSYLNGDMQRQAYLASEEVILFKKAKNMDSHKNPHQALTGNPFLWVRGNFGGGVI